MAESARILLMANAGANASEISSQLFITPKKVTRWRKRFLDKGLTGLEKDAPRPGRIPLINRAAIKEVVRLTTQDKFTNATHWITRSMAAATGISDSRVLRIWRADGLKPQRIETFKLSKDPNFSQKLEAIVGLYLNSPDQAIVLSVDEKSQVQALDRTEPVLPMKPGRAGTISHDY